MSTSTDVINVLHVDDDTDLTELITIHLEREDDRITVHTAESVNEGLDRIPDWNIDCLVSDYEMPGKNGIEFLKIVREDYPNLPFILYTGKGSEEIASTAISAGVTDYLQKTIGTDQYTILANRITNAVESYWSQQALINRNQELRRNKRAMDEAPVGITITDPTQEDNPIVYANTTFQELTGYANDEVIGRNCRFLQGENTAPQSVATIRAALDRQKPVTVDLRNYRKDSTEFWNRISIAPVRADNGSIINYVGFQQDITDHKQRKRDLERTNALFSTLFDTLPQGVLAEDESRNVLASINRCSSFSRCQSRFSY